MSNVQPRYGIVRRGKLVTFYKNGDPFYKGLQTSVSGKHFVTLSTLLSWLNDKIPLISGIKHIFRLPDGAEVADVTQFEAGKSYVVSNVRKFNASVKYGESHLKFPRVLDQTEFEVDRNPDVDFQLEDAEEVARRNREETNEFRQDFTGRSDRTNRENVLAMLNRRPLPVEGIRDDDRPFHSENVESLPGGRGRGGGGGGGYSAFDEAVTFDRKDSDFKSPTRLPKLQDEDAVKGSFSNVGTRRRSKAASIESSAESSGSGSEKLSSMDQPRNRTFLPIHESRRQKFGRLPTLDRPSNDVRLPPIRTPYSLPRNFGPSWQYREAKNPPYSSSSLPNSTEQATTSSAGKLWSPMSLNDRQIKYESKPRIIQMTSNLVRESSQRVIFNPKTLQSFEEVLKDLENVVSIPYPPVTAIFTAEEPFVKVLSLSHLSGELRHCEDFLVCGREGVPLEIQPNFSTNPSRDSDQRGRRSNVSRLLKETRSEERLDSDFSNSFENPLRRRIFKQSGKSEPSLDNHPHQNHRHHHHNQQQQPHLKPVNLYLNKKPTNEDVQITVGCQSKNCECRLHETLSQLLHS